MTVRGRSRVDDQPGRPVKPTGQSMAYQLTALGISGVGAAQGASDREARVAEIAWLQRFAGSLRAGRTWPEHANEVKI